MSISKPGSLIAIFLLSITVIADGFFKDYLESATNVDVRIDNLPMQLGNWEGSESEGLGIRELETLQLNRYVRRYYKNEEGKTVFLYIGYWKQQSGDHQAAKHSPRLCLPSSGWKIADEKSIVTSGETLSEPLTTSQLLANYGTQANLFYYWFFSGNDTYWKESNALIQIMLNTLLHGRTDGGIVEISVPVSGEKPLPEARKEAEELTASFIKVLKPELDKLIEDSMNAPR